jgi:acyl-CoA thioester hydrolase
MMSNETIPSPFVDSSLRVKPDWIDGNGHMNVAYYLKAFDEGFEPAYRFLEVSTEQSLSRGLSSMTAEVSVRYVQELFVAAPLKITTQLLDCDRKRAHWVQLMYHAEQGYLAASAEWLILHIDMTARRVAPLPDDLYARLLATRDAHAGLAIPLTIGRAVGLGNKR